MRITLADVVAALGVLVTAPAMAGMGLTLLGGRAPYDSLVGTVVLGVVLTIAGLVPRFERHRLGWTSQTDALLRARQQVRRAAVAPEPERTAADRAPERRRAVTVGAEGARIPGSA
jgi:hypothetical protein